MMPELEDFGLIFHESYKINPDYSKWVLDHPSEHATPLFHTTYTYKFSAH